MPRSRFLLEVLLACLFLTLAAAPAAAAPGLPPGLHFYLPLLGREMTFPLQPPTPVPPSPHPGLPLARFATDDFSGPFVCASCHNNLTDASGADVTMSTHWRATMMANAARDPLWQAKVSAEIQQHPELQAEIEATCSRCHMPMAYTQALVLGQIPAIFGDAGFLNPNHPLHQAAMDGVSCTLCHQIQPTGLGTADSFSGHFVIDTGTQPPQRTIFGPYPDPDSMGAMIMRQGSGYNPRQGLHMTGSAFCATCHTLFTDHAAAGAEGNGFPEQVPYLEWLHSSYGDGVGEDKQCQDCHMPVADGAVAIYPGWPEHEPFFQHHFVGGNIFMLKVLQAHVEELKLTASTADFETVIERTRTQLQERTADVTIPSLTREQDTLAALVRVENKTGHKLPTSYPARRAWLHVIASDASGRVLFESGRALSDGGIVGNDGDLDPAGFEPHHTTISDPTDVQIYEAIMQDAGGQTTFTLLDAAAYGKDNRLLPEGFDKATASADIAVVGAAATDPDFVGGADAVVYEIDVSGRPGPFTVRAELLYQSLMLGFVQDLRRSSTPEIERFSRYFEQADRLPTLIDAAQATLP